LFIGRSAGTAVVVPLPAFLPSPGEGRDRQELSTAGAGPG
jgi:hypothetical protein